MANQLTDSEAKMLRERCQKFGLGYFQHKTEPFGIFTPDASAMAFGSELLLAAKEKACKFACAACEEGEPLHPPPTGKVGWWHDLGNGLRMKCYATEIRNSCWGDLFKGQ